jgi:hypothetical protein
VEHEPSSLAIPSHVAERMNRLDKDMLFIVVVSKSIGISSLHNVIAASFIPAIDCRPQNNGTLETPKVFLQRCDRFSKGEKK